MDVSDIRHSLHVEADHLEAEVIRHLVDELGPRGQRAAQHLATARSLLADGLDRHLRGADLVAFSLREATTSIIEIPRGSARGQTRSVVTPVLAAYETYQANLGSGNAEVQGISLAALLERVAELEVLRVSWVERDLIAGLVERTGAVAFAARAELVREIQDLRDTANFGVHDGISAEQALSAYNRTTAVLRRLFMRPVDRNEQLERLAAIEAPTPNYLATLRRLLISPEHMRTFLRSLTTSEWFESLGDDALFDPPVDGTAWAGYAPAESRGAADPAGTVVWFSRMYQRCRTSSLQAAHIFRAAHGLGESADDLLVQIVTDHLGSSAIREQAWAFVAGVDADRFVVERLADLLLNDHDDADWQVAEIAAKLAAGVTTENGHRRLTILAHEIRHAAGKPYALQFALDAYPCLDDLAGADHPDRLSALLAAFIAGVSHGSDVFGRGSLDEVMAALPPAARDRIRAWTLATDPQSDQAEIQRELAHAIATRERSGDDAHLVAKLTAGGPDVGVWDTLVDRLGPAPEAESVVAATVGAGEDANRLWRAYRWLGLIPAASHRAWSAPFEWTSSQFGRPDVDSYMRRRGVEVWTGQSPLSVDELLALDVNEAAKLVRRWRREPGDHRTGTRELARVLEQAVATAPERWLAAPGETARRLHEPMYIAHFLRGAAIAIKAGTIPVDVDELLGVVELIGTAPWVPEPLGERDWDFDSTWLPAQAAALDLIESLADCSVGYGTRVDDVWAFIDAAARDPFARAGITGDDPLTVALNRSDTRALWTALQVVRRNEQRGPVAMQVLEGLLALGLAAAGQDGAIWRAVIAAHFRVTVAARPDWLDANQDALFEPENDPELGRSTLESALKWNPQPLPWILRHRRREVLAAARRGAEDGLEYVLVGHLWQLDGYGAQEILALLRADSGITPRLGESLGRLLRGVDGEVNDLGVSLWEQILDAELGHDMSGFGWLAEACGIADGAWCRLTLRTARATPTGLDWSSRVAERAAAMTASETTLALLDELVRHPRRPWDGYRAAEHALTHLSAARGPLLETPEYRRLHAALVERGLTGV
ncbi:hypothetical protein GXP71_00020 [Cellulomonas sp. H30R-01]|uniref:hypothetical protein n=1 Tax=Cellulomonas sp. H30R-01 TaxID=2704467 RepID=UPI00138C350B|nr:hypothetical protein [Cellulomonas sp. H30R-01]QHT54643.1 hypothetical protein GXP71_00020 [Cellulomonas sp. H30R-01]